MYSIKNKKDIPYLLKYHRAKDMVNIMRFFPGLSPVDDLAVIVDEDDFEKNKDKIEQLENIRNGNPITEPCMRSIIIKNLNQDRLEALKMIKDKNKNGVLVLFHLENEISNRYERYAGISVGISLGNAVYIDAVGKGFDGREVLKGISCHERYTIPWNDIRRVNIDNFKTYNTYMINDKDYQKSRDERIDFLLKCDVSNDILDKKIPKKYEAIPDFIWLDVIKNVIKPLEKNEDYLRSEGFLEFNLSGHTEGKKFRPWQMADDQRM